MNQPVLIVDDNPDIRAVVARILRMLGEQAVCVPGGDEALDYLRHGGQPKLVLLDLMMPGVDGLAVLRAIRGDPALARLPVVVFSGAGERELGQAMCGGADDCLRKGSVGIDEIRDRVSRFAGRPHLDADAAPPGRSPGGARMYCQNAAWA